MKFYRKYTFEVWVFALSLLANILVFLPHLIGYLNQTPELRFTAISADFFMDEFSYFAWVKQAIDGNFLFGILYTTEYHQSLVFHPIFLLIGFTQKLLKIPTEFLWYLGCLTSNFFLASSIYIFIKKVLSDSFTRILAFAIIMFGGGLGWITQFPTADKLYTEATIFQTLRWPIIFSLAAGLLVLSFYFIIKSYQENSKYLAVMAGLSGFVLILIHPYDVVTFYIIPLGFLVNLYFLKRIQLTKKLVLISILWFVPPLIPSLYYFFLSLSNQVYRQNSQIEMLSGPVMEYVLGYGLIGVLAILGFIFFKGIFSNDKVFLISWSLFGAIILYFPISFQRRFVMGLIVPLGILSAQFVVYALEKVEVILEYKYKSLINGTIITLLVIFLFGTNADVLKKDIENVNAMSFPHYIDTPTLNAIGWMDKNISKDSVILSSYDMGMIIPRYSGNNVYAGHWAQTLDLNTKLFLINQFFSGQLSGEEQRILFKDSGVDYVFVRGLDFDFPGNISILNQNTMLESIYDSRGVIIFKVK